jgi:glutaminyl-peptide cyclotransferase
LRWAIAAGFFLAALQWLHPAALYASPKTPRFEPDRAFSYIEAQCAFGPRPPGSAAHDRTGQYLAKFLRKRGAEVTEQSFVVSVGDSSVNLTNIVGTFYPELRPRVALCAHWDTRPWADMEPDSSRRSEPILGANDGGSGVAVLMEVANALASRAPIYGVDLVLFDGEDMGGRYGLDYALGAKQFVSRAEVLPAAAILIDMVADRDVDLPVEGYSQKLAPALAGIVWRTARGLGLSEFRSDTGSYVFDDHVPLLIAGVPAIDIIDMDYPYWHTLSDTPENCSPAGLDAVGTLLLHLLYSPEALLGPPER